ncbi:MAG: HAMP domain-containing sensor histidine kinase, partial [Desulfobulbaceae bacterium]|nr:HAMP domain-containing sensor histidine kinase [Desulfobulbaceae bacterium]
MKIRHKITLWISGIALLAALALASFIFKELLEEPLRLIDNELTFMAESLFSQGANSSSEPWRIDDAALPHPSGQYWIKVVDPENEMVYASSLTQFTEIPERRGGHSRYNAEQVIPRAAIDLGQDDGDEVAFRVRVFARQVNGRVLTMHIAKPVEELEEEMIHVLLQALLGLLICMTLIVFVSYFLAGRILQPVVVMTRLARKISEDSLDQRIPLNKNNDELTALGQALNLMLDGLQYSFTRQRAFISNASHELKSPLTRLLLTQDELVQNQTLSPEIRVDLDRQLTTMRWMKKLIQNLLNLSHLEQQDILVLETVNLSVLFAGVLENYQEMLAATAIAVRIDLEEDMVLQGDRLKLQRLFINLVDNAIRYNDPEQGKLNITG